MNDRRFDGSQTIEDPTRAARAAWMRALEATAAIPRDPERTLPVLLEDVAERRGEAPALLTHSNSLSFRALADRISHYAHWARSQDVKVGDAVCLLMPNSADYLAAWLGIARVGGVAALLNTSLRGVALAHCLTTVAPKRILVCESLLDGFDPSLAQAWADAIWVHGQSNCGFPRVDFDSGVTRAERVPASRTVTIADRALYIFTSGTTGLPKAAIVSHRRVMAWCLWFAGLLETTSSDRMYNCLPLYHSVGGLVATGSVLVNGGSVFIRDRFSASSFWNDVASQECTLFQYIGELCRYLLQAPPHALETRHRLRLCCGNGLRGDIWDDFKRRFAIPRILEFYASTEGNLSLYNVEEKPGAIGRVPKFLPQRGAIALVKSEPADQNPVRDREGFCVKCEPGETGEAIARVGAGDAAAFEGYTNQTETEKKILRNVFQQNDAWFRTGDLMRQDREGFFYFVDRLGDTFRWKGENVSTLEVAEAICACPGVREAVVFGVAVPHADGKAGMALVAADPTFDLEDLRRRLAAGLPAYARPIFLRLGAGADVTETHKYKKATLVEEGYDPERVSDPLYYFDPEARTYLSLDGAGYAKIRAGGLRW